jgi:hypothetical protein
MTDAMMSLKTLVIGPSEAETFWTAFLRKLTRRGLRGVKLIISDAHDDRHGDDAARLAHL